MQVTHLADHDRTDVDGDVEGRAYAEVAHVARLVLIDAADHRERRTNAGRTSNPAVRQPGHDDLIAHVAMDLAAIRGHRVSDVERDPIEQLMEAQGTEALGDGRRVGEVHEQKDAFLEPRSVVATGHEARQDAGTEHPAQLTDDVEQERDEEGEADVRPAEDVSGIGEGHARGERSQKEADDDEAEVDERSNADRDGERPSSKPPAPLAVRSRDIKEEDRDEDQPSGQGASSHVARIEWARQRDIHHTGRHARQQDDDEATEYSDRLW